MVQVLLRDSTSISPDCSAVNRSLASSAMNVTLVGSPKIAAAMPRQRSTSRPVQLPLSSGMPKPGSPGLAPQVRKPFCLTVSRVPAETAVVAHPNAVNAAIDKMIFFMTCASPTLVVQATNQRWANDQTPATQRVTPLTSVGVSGAEVADRTTASHAVFAQRSRAQRRPRHRPSLRLYCRLFWGT